MKKYLSLLLAGLLLLGLCACGTQSADLPQEAGDTPNSTIVPETSAKEASAVSGPVTTEDEVRALYTPDREKDPTLPPVQSVTEYQGDFLVLLGWENDSQWLDWVYGQSGIRHRLLFLDQPIIDLEITGPASVRVVTGGPNIYNGVPGFPHVEYASLSLLYDELGQPLDYDPYSSSGTNASEPYWAHAGESWFMGMTGRREAIRSAQLDAGGVTVAFAPLADGSDFTAAYCEIPYTNVALSEDGSTLTITMYDTYLDSGLLTKDTDSPEFLDYLHSYGSLYPEDFPAGELVGDCVLVEHSDLRQEGDNAVLTLTLNTDHLRTSALGGDDAYFQFTSDGGYTGIADDGPYLRIQLRATMSLFDN